MRTSGHTLESSRRPGAVVRYWPARGGPPDAIGIHIEYTCRDGDAWHLAFVSVPQWLAIHRQAGRFHGMTFCSLRVSGSSLIRDFILDKYYPSPCYRIGATLCRS